MISFGDLVTTFADELFSCLLGVSACVELGLYEEAIAWCDKGLTVSFYDSSQVMRVMQSDRRKTHKLSPLVNWIFMFC